MIRVFRLRKNKDFNKVFNLGKSVADRNLVLYVKPRLGDINSRFGFSVSKKIGKAVVRNKIRRRLGEIARLIIKDKLKQTYDIVVIARKPVVNASYSELEKSFLYLCKKIGIC